MFRCEPILHRHRLETGAGAQVGANIVMGFEIAEDQPAAVQVKQRIAGRAGRGIAAAGNLAHVEISRGDTDRARRPKPGRIFGIKAPLRRNIVLGGVFRIEQFRCHHEIAHAWIDQMAVFGGEGRNAGIGHDGRLTTFIDVGDGSNYLPLIMTTRPIITLPDEKLLRQMSVPVKTVDEDTRKLFDDMLETMYAAPGIGLAAIQIGVPRRMLVIDLAKEGEAYKPLFIANPEIVWSSPELSDYEEGCLSIPEYYEMVERPREVKVHYRDRNNEAMELHAGGLLATCLQHEIDHLNGVLFIDHISKLKRDRVIKKFQKAQKLGKL
jgi:peptide deformylase